MSNKKTIELVAEIIGATVQNYEVIREGSNVIYIKF